MPSMVASTDNLNGMVECMSPSEEEALPIALVHGMFGWGELTPLWGAAPRYFPLDEMRRSTRRMVVAVQVGSNTSNHDRACEAFAQLRGARTDYGEAHAGLCGHERFGRDHRDRPLLPRWDANHPIHLVGHSLGGNTALTLVTLLASDFWGVGTSAKWVRSVSTICSPLRGCTLPFTWGLQHRAQVRACDGGGEGLTDQLLRSSGSSVATPCSDALGGRRSRGLSSASVDDLASRGCRPGLPPRLFSVAHVLAALCSPLLKAQLSWPWLKGLYDFGVDQWADHATWSAMLSMRHPYWLTGDNTIVDTTPSVCARDLRAARENLRALYLVCVTCDPARPMVPPSRQTRLATAAAAALLALALVRFRREVAMLLRHARGGVKRRFLLTLAALAALLRHRTAKERASPKLALVVAAGAAVATTAAAVTGAALVTMLRVPLRLPSAAPGNLQQLAPLRPLTEALRPALHAYLLPWLVRPALRLNSAAIHRTIALLQGDLRVTFGNDVRAVAPPSTTRYEIPPHRPTPLSTPLHLTACTHHSPPASDHRTMTASSSCPRT